MNKNVTTIIWALSISAVLVACYKSKKLPKEDDVTKTSSTEYDQKNMPASAPTYSDGKNSEDYEEGLKDGIQDGEEEGIDGGSYSHKYRGKSDDYKAGYREGYDETYSEGVYVATEDEREYREIMDEHDLDDYGDDE